MTNGHAPAMLNAGPFTGRTGTTLPWQMLQTPEREQQFAIERSIVVARRRAAARQSFYLISPDIKPEQTTSQKIFDAIEALYLSSNRPRDRQIANRITTLHREAIAEGDHISPVSLSQLKDFFLTYPELGIPKITLTPDGTLRTRWIHGPGSFVAIEFTGEPLAKLVAEIPRDNGLTARHFSTEPVRSILLIARAIGASFA